MCGRWRKSDLINKAKGVDANILRQACSFAVKEPESVSVWEAEEDKSGV